MEMKMSRRKRKFRTREPAPDLILIICEGEKTEPLYFKKFPITAKQVQRVVIGTGRNTLSLVRLVEQEIEKAKEKYQNEWDIKLKNKNIIVWCVFDKDSFKDDNFDNVIDKAKAKGYNVAYSNEAFELWYLLHFHYYNTGMSREQYGEKLSKVLGFTYEKNSNEMYDTLKPLQDEAIANAKRLLATYKPHIPNKDNPSTTVFELVEYLNRYIR